MTKQEIEKKAQEILNRLGDFTYDDIQNITYEVRSLTRKMKLIF